MGRFPDPRSPNRPARQHDAVRPRGGLASSFAANRALAAAYAPAGPMTAHVRPARSPCRRGAMAIAAPPPPAAIGPRGGPRPAPRRGALVGKAHHYKRPALRNGAHPPVAARPAPTARYRQVSTGPPLAAVQENLHFAPMCRDHQHARRATGVSPQESAPPAAPAVVAAQAHRRRAPGRRTDSRAHQAARSPRSTTGRQSHMAEGGTEKAIHHDNRS